METNSLYNLGKLMIIKLMVDGKRMYEAAGINLGPYIIWKGTLRNTDFQTDSLSMKILPSNLEQTKGLIRQLAESQFKGRRIEIA
jgi:hypothetical protein